MANLEQFIQNMVNMCNDNSYGYRLGGWGGQRITIVQAPS